MKPSFLLIVCFWFVAYSSVKTQSADMLKPSLPELPLISMESAGINKDSIQQLLSLIESTPPNDFRGMVVLKDHQLVIEAYFNTYWRNSIHDIRSAGKSVTALLVGIALKEGLVKSLDQSVYDFFSKAKYPSLNQNYQQIKIRHLLDMASGLDADTDNTRSTGHAANWIARKNWTSYLLGVPLSFPPGEKWVYADINPILLGAIIETTSGMSLKDYAKKKLFDPLGINQYYWYTNVSNQTGAAGNLYLSTLDFAKLGQLVLNKGQWQNSQILDMGYVSLLSDETFDISDSNPYADTYGMLWYKSHRKFGGKQFDYLFASGNGGNLLVVVPEERLVIALTSSAYGPGLGHSRSYKILSKVLAALE